MKSNYKIVIGRSGEVDGPYTDKEGTLLTKGGGTILLEGDRNWDGLGHNAILSDAGKDYLVFHAYDVNDNGNPKLRILRSEWDKDGWPTVVNESK
ncbi:MAG TPA: family 43 glycosylhydrolase [Hanamia sp.]